MSKGPVILPPESPLATVKEAALALGLSESHVHYLVKNGAIPAFRPGVRSTRILKADLALYLENSRVMKAGRQ